ncbi:MAG: hypothetical protein K1X85_10970 [Ignavibacteria bacterium]|nr:hypothetical protein [Ignavibacteria bacterium]
MDESKMSAGLHSDILLAYYRNRVLPSLVINADGTGADSDTSFAAYAG